MKNGLWRYALVASFAVILAGCASHHSSAEVSEPYGFFSGLWHGLIAPFSLLGLLLSWLASLLGFSLLAGLHVIGYPNTGWAFYYVGFVLGLVASFGGGQSAR